MSGSRTAADAGEPVGVPSRDGLLARPLHVFVRDFPETLAVLRRADVDVPRRGADMIADVVDDEDPTLLDRLLAAVDWRR